MNIADEITELYLNNNYSNNISIGLSYKYINNQKTDNLSITFYVKNKLPIDQVPENELIPSEIILNGQSYATDVVELGSESNAEFASCYLSSTDPEILRLQTNTTPLKGGQELIVFPENFSTQNYTFCTLGFMCVDNDDNKFVGITSIHSILSRLALAPDRNQTTEDSSPYNTYEKSLSYGGTSYKPGTLGIWGDKQTTNQPDTIINSYIKKYSGLRLTPNVNYTDIAVIGIGNQNTPTENLLNQDSHKIYVPSTETEYSDVMVFATSQEIESLLSDNPKIYSTGRSSGPKGYAETDASGTSWCEIEIVAIEASINIIFYSQQYTFSDCIIFAYSDQLDSNSVVSVGDSGAALIAEYPNGVRKIIGVVFAKAGVVGYATRIDRIVNEFNIRPWDWTSVIDPTELNSRLQISDPTLYSVTPNSQYASSGNIVVNNKKYYQCGFTKQRY